MDLFEKCLETVEKCLKDVKLSKTDVDDIVLVGGSTRIQKVQQLLQDYFNGKQLCRVINPDEAVAYGASSHAAILAGVEDIKDTVLVDITPLSLGIELSNKSLKVIVPRNTTIPTKKFAKLVTAEDYLVEDIFPVYKGERYHNNILGEFRLYNLPPKPKGQCRFNVCFDMDANGILTVSANLVGTNNTEQITVTEHNGRLAKDDIDRMVKESEMYKTQDEEFKRVVKAKSSLESYIEEIMKIMRRCHDTIDEKDMRLMTEASQHTIGWLDWNHLCDDAAKFDQKKDELESVCGEFSRKMRYSVDKKWGKSKV